MGPIPGWVKDQPPASPFNARSDTVVAKPMFRSAFKLQRCLVVASGFYEWRKLDAKSKQSYYITFTNGGPMPMAGVWERWENPEGEMVDSCKIVTHAANDMMAPLHYRMPVILSDALIDPWLDRSIATAPEIQLMLVHYPSDEKQGRPVSQAVGNVRNKGEELVQPIEA